VSFNNKSTRYAANLQTPKTPDSVIARGTAIDGMFDFFENLGFVENEDFCVAETLMLGHLPDWLKVDQLHESASLAGVPKTKLVGL
jgi:hypothetical protein